jgi:hypothetical protein
MYDVRQVRPVSVVEVAVPKSIAVAKLLMVLNLYPVAPDDDPHFQVICVADETCTPATGVAGAIMRLIFIDCPNPFPQIPNSETAIDPLIVPNATVIAAVPCPLVIVDPVGTCQW